MMRVRRISLAAAITISLFSVLLISCQGTGRKYIIPEKKFIEVLVDLHLADAIAVENMNLAQNYLLDSVALYNAVFNKHQVSRVQFDSTMSYYSQRPDDLQKIYNKLTARLKTMEKEVEAEQEAIRAREEVLVWQVLQPYNFPPLAGNKIEINVPIQDTGIYMVTATVILHPDDASLNPRMSLYFYNDKDTTENSRIKFNDLMYTQRDGKPRTYTATKELVNPEVTHIRGTIVNYSNSDSLFRRHMEVSDIKITRKKKME